MAQHSCAGSSRLGFKKLHFTAAEWARGPKSCADAYGRKAGSRAAEQARQDTPAAVLAEEPVHQRTPAAGQDGQQAPGDPLQVVQEPAAKVGPAEHLCMYGVCQHVNAVTTSVHRAISRMTDGHVATWL